MTSKDKLELTNLVLEAKAESSRAIELAREVAANNARAFRRIYEKLDAILARLPEATP